MKPKDAIFDHKKFRAAALASLVAFLGAYASGLSDTGDFIRALGNVDWTLVVGPWLAAIVGQGLADFGKERVSKSPVEE